MKEALSSFDIYTLVAEFQQLVNGRIEQLYQPDKNKLLLKLRLPSRNKVVLLIKNGKWITITQQTLTMPKRPTNFIMAMRKWISNGKIKSIIQHNFDRIIIFEIEKRNGLHRLIIELFGEGNIILLDPRAEILLSLISRGWKGRTIKKGEKYAFPPSRLNLLELGFDLFKRSLLASRGDLVRTLATTFNLGGQWAEEVCLRAKIEKTKLAEELREGEIKQAHRVLTDLIKQLEQERFEPSLIYKLKDGERELLDATPIKLLMYRSGDFQIKKMKSFTEATDFLWSKEVIKTEQQVKLENELARLNRVLVRQEELEQKFEKEARELKEKGELLYLNYKKCEEVLSKAKGEKARIIELVGREGRPVKLLLDPKKSVAKNAGDYYAKAKRVSKKAEGAKRAIEQSKLKISKLKEEGFAPKPSELSKKPLHRYWFERYRWFISSKGNLVLAGKDAASNDRLVKHHLKQKDKYAHADIWGAPSCVVKASDLKGKPLKIETETLREACQFASVYSKGWQKFGFIQAYWVEPEQVSKTPEAGEWVPKGAWIIRGKRNYQKCDLELAIGKIEIESEERAMAGPPSVFIKQSKQYVVLVPGSKEKNLAAKQLAKAMNLPFEEIQKIMPPGNVSLKARAGMRDENISSE
jgi:predicted ribosome quality control (RQC) complex YloA/Tae2 family protein